MSSFLHGDPLSAGDDPLSSSAPPPPALPSVAGSSASIPPPAPPRDAVQEFLGRPVPVREHSEFSVPQTLDGVRTLVEAGVWRGAAALSERLLASTHPVDVLLTLRWYRIVALIKLHEVAKAEREMAMLGDLRSPSWQYERYPGVYPGLSGTMVPFALLILHAMLPSYSGNHDHALARLYALLSHETAAAAEASAEGTASQRIAERSQVMLAIVNVLCAVQEYPNAVAHLEQLIAAVQSAPSSAPQPGAGSDAGVTYDPAAGAGSGKLSQPELAPLLSLLGRVHLHLGNLEAAEDAFNRLECRVLGADDSAQVRLNRGLLAMGSSQYSAALAEFEAALAIDPASTIAANNAAVCQLYCCRLSDAVGTMEKQLKRDPQTSMHPVLVSNLANLYQMISSPGGVSNKHALERLVHAVASDDFDTSVLSLGQQ